MEIGKIYFYTSSITDWKHLLAPDKFKDVIINSLTYLSSKNLISVYGFVIMPNHIHLIFEMNSMNGKEKPVASLMKFTAHEFKKMLGSEKIDIYRVECNSREYQFWQRDPLAVELYSREVIEQKLEYIHFNPVSKKWSLCEDYCEYQYSSALYYETGVDNFGFLKHYMDRI